MTNTVFKISKTRLKEFLNSLITKYDLYAPVSNQISKFRKIGNAREVQILPNRTDISLKSVFFPQKEDFFHYEKDGEKYRIFDCLQREEKKKVIFGARGCDVRAMSILDSYMRDEFSDPYYEAKIKGTVIIGMTCDYPRESCFCTALGGMMPVHYDLWFTNIEAYYLVEVGSDAGMQIINDMFLPADENDIEIKIKKMEKVEREIERRTKITLCEIKRCSNKIVARAEDKLWDELASICLACGKCNFICPTCHCFDVRDFTDMTGAEGIRKRVWDSCHLYEYARTSAENFRKSRVARVRYRIYDKFVFPVMRYGFYACTGCGRCTDVCPANINIKNVLKEMIA